MKNDQQYCTAVKGGLKFEAIVAVFVNGLQIKRSHQPCLEELLSDSLSAKVFFFFFF